MVIDAASFRDPAGRIFSQDGEIYRSVFEPGCPDYESARQEGLFDELVGKELLHPHEEIEQKPEGSPAGTVHCLRHPRLPFISYPWEWTFSMLKDAALLHLDMMDILVRRGFWLRDASAFNVQFDGRGLRFIDVLSIGRRIPESPWPAYGQFCEHFLAPLALAAYGDVRTLGLWRNNIDGYPLDMVNRLLPFRRKFSPGIFMHLVLHAWFQSLADRKEGGDDALKAGKARVSERGLIGIIRSLRKAVNAVSWKRSSRIWDKYASIRTYSEDDVSRKTEFVKGAIEQVQPSLVWDLGANTGEFSRLSAATARFVVSIEGDPACAEQIYLERKSADNPLPVLPLTMDLANPSPALGWDCSERPSLQERGPADLVLALALIHHLVLSSCIPMAKVASWFRSLSPRLIVEFVPPDDPMVKRLLSNRQGDHLPYDQQVFQSAFDRHFQREKELSLGNGRILYLLSPRLQS